MTTLPRSIRLRKRRATVSVLLWLALGLALGLVAAWWLYHATRVSL